MLARQTSRENEKNGSVCYSHHMPPLHHHHHCHYHHCVCTYCIQMKSMHLLFGHHYSVVF